MMRHLQAFLVAHTAAGEEYDGQGACLKWTDKWAERELPEGGRQVRWVVMCVCVTGATAVHFISAANQR